MKAIYKDFEGVDRIAEYFYGNRGISPIAYLEIRSVEGKVLMRRKMEEWEASNFFNNIVDNPN